MFFSGFHEAYRLEVIFLKYVSRPFPPASNALERKAAAGSLREQFSGRGYNRNRPVGDR
jgi:hypothetical protein